ncbi:MAG TPA: tRNA (guanine(46)-N(7))-methyltransferase TrmB [Candidatus Cybelea sp.]|nr:tRNA (guanine(46)-N(7))-methyltransferase TrmB [Candidatus Cybelea sp.]
MVASELINRRILYGRRTGHRLRAGRRDALANLLPAYAIDLPESGTLDPAILFPRSCTEYWLEVGFGSGEHVIAQAKANPAVGIIGCEPFINGVSMLLRHLDLERLENVRVHAEDARAVIDVLPPASLSRVHVLFPDPWPKRRHHRRRFIGKPTLDALSRVMRPGAELRIATDHMECARWMLWHGLSHPAFDWLAEGPADWLTRNECESPTRYETKALAAGARCLYFRFRRR